MKVVVISYSFTGNNEALASSIAHEISAEHIKISEARSRTMGTIILDLILNRIPTVQPEPVKLSNYDIILLFGPVWIGKIATPLRAYFKYMKSSTTRYAFISLSGGADSDNPKIKGELLSRVGREPMVLIDEHISSLLPSDPKPTRNDTSSYRLNDKDLNLLTNKIMNLIHEIS